MKNKRYLNDNMKESGKFTKYHNKRERIEMSMEFPKRIAHENIFLFGDKNRTV